MQAVQTRNCRRSGNDKTKELRQRIDASLDTLAKSVDAVRASETFKAYLDVQAKFHRYSWCNSLLILSQRPDASRVAGYRSWQKLGRQVCKGERGIMIFAPCPWKRTCFWLPDHTGEFQFLMIICQDPAAITHIHHVLRA